LQDKGEVTGVILLFLCVTHKKSECVVHFLLQRWKKWLFHDRHRRPMSHHSVWTVI